MNWQPASDFDKRNRTWALVLPASGSSADVAVYCSPIDAWQFYDGTRMKHEDISQVCILRNPDGSRVDGQDLGEG